MTDVTVSLDGKEIAKEVAKASELDTIFGVELVSIGQWLTSTGPREFTKAMLDAIIASQDDPSIKPPRLILGHTPDEEPYMESVSPNGKDGFFGEQPTIGKFVNLRMNDAENTIIADLVGVPKWLAEILPTAFPNRSVEVYYNVTTAKAKYAAIMPRVAALGINLPAVASLADLQILYSEEGPDGVELVHVGERIAASAPGAEFAKFSIDVEAVRTAYYDEFAQGDRFWWWLKAMFVNPTIIISIDEDTGVLYAVPWSSTSDEVTFGEPVEVFMQYVEQETGKVAAQRACYDAFFLGADIVYHNAAESRPEEHNEDKFQEQQAALGADRVVTLEIQLPQEA
jgi:hypothetical protein